MSSFVSAVKRWYHRLGASDEREELEYKKNVYHLSQEQLQVEVETQKTLEITVSAFKKHLAEQEAKEEELRRFRDS
jgi:hypothetical protein